MNRKSFLDTIIGVLTLGAVLPKSRGRYLSIKNKGHAILQEQLDGLRDEYDRQLAQKKQDIEMAIRIRTVQPETRITI